MRVYVDLIRETLKELAADGRLREIDVTVAAFSIVGMILWLPRWFNPAGRLTPEEAADAIASLALGGLLHARPVARPRKRGSI
jgi:hypothetical protein